MLEYLQKNYLNPHPKVKKKRKSAKVSDDKIKIIDYSDKGWSLNADDEEDVEDVQLDELPAVAEVVDERPPEQIEIDKYKSSTNWKPLGYKHDKDYLPRKRSFKDRKNPEFLEELSDCKHRARERSRPDSNNSLSYDLLLPRKRLDSSDVSPTRKHHDSRDVSPPRKRHDSSDVSLPRKRHDSSDVSPPRKRHDSGDVSPPRKRLGSSDASPPRKRDNSSNVSPPRKRHDSSDVSLPRKRLDSSDASPPRKRHDSSDVSPPRRKNSQARETIDKTLISKEPKSETNETIYRDRATGKKREVNRDLEAKQKLIQDKVQKWKAGAAQSKRQQVAAEEAVHEMSKGFTRLEGDEDLEKYLKDKTREDDPMAEYISKKSRKKDKRIEYPKFKGAWPANRFNIPPGYRWDGVDRSNGFEKKYFDSVNSKKAVAEIAHKWSVEEM